MIDYNAARAVALVVQTGSFDRAAKALNVTPSAVSQRVRQLEERLGAVLIERGTPCVATDKGAWLCRHMEQIGLLERDLLAHLPGLEDRPQMRATLDIAANSDSIGTWFLPPVAAFAESSGYLMNIAVDDEGHTAEWLRRGRVVAAVTASAEPIQGCKVKRLGRLRYVATASPAFFARHFAHGVTAASLAQAPAITFNHKDRLQHDWAERALGPATSFPTHWLPSTQGFVDACLAGMGWCLNPIQLVDAHLRAGRLVSLMPKAPFDVELFWQISRIAADRLAGLTDAVVAAGKGALVA
jgi:LysR family transcriptional regulator (chromosome initiation inhibitor)